MSNSNQLKTLLEKLRPFQREAFEFATSTKLIKSKSKPSSRNKKNTKKNNDVVSDGDDCRGRILLADEMVCREFFFFITTLEFILKKAKTCRFC